MPELSVEASQESETCEPVTAVTSRFSGGEGGVVSRTVSTTSRSLVDLLPLPSTASTQK